MALKAEVKKRWVKALRSGEFQQGKGYLKLLPFGRQKATRYCCLGVLCQIEGVRENHSFDAKSVNFGKSNTRLSDYMLRKIGLNESEMKNLMRMNDSGDKTFKQIAQYIQVNV